MPQGHIWIITGPAGSGKSTVAQSLATSLQLQYIEGDDYHPPANVNKMSHGIPLTDEDRWSWLEQLRAKALQAIAAGSPGVVVTCSALKRSYRDVIRKAPESDTSAAVHFVYLKVDERELLKRVRARQGHYMKDDMVKSQIDSLEEPSDDELDCVRLDVTTQSVDEVCAEALAAVRAKLAALDR